VFFEEVKHFWGDACCQLLFWEVFVIH
jgi:hypothetical protein